MKNQKRESTTWDKLVRLATDVGIISMEQPWGSGAENRARMTRLPSAEYLQCASLLIKLGVQRNVSSNHLVAFVTISLRVIKCDEIEPQVLSQIAANCISAIISSTKQLELNACHEIVSLFDDALACWPRFLQKTPIRVLLAVLRGRAARLAADGIEQALRDSKIRMAHLRDADMARSLLMLGADADVDWRTLLNAVVMDVPRQIVGRRLAQILATLAATEVPRK